MDFYLQVGSVHAVHAHAMGRGSLGLRAQQESPFLKNGLSSPDTSVPSKFRITSDASSLFPRSMEWEILGMCQHAMYGGQMYRGHVEITHPHMAHALRWPVQC